MKQFLLLITCIFLCYEHSQAQVFTHYPAKDGIETIISKAKEKGISDPEVFAIASGNMTVSQMPVQVTFSVSTGKANIWLYYIKSQSDNNNKLVLALVYSVFLGQELYTTYDVPFNTFNQYLPFEPVSSLDSYQWLNSTDLYSKISVNANYISYHNTSGKTDPNAVLLAVNTLPQYGNNTAYWIMEFPTVGERFICGIDAVSGVTRCENLTNGDIKQVDGAELYIFPNPANEYLSVKTNEVFSDSDLKINIYDIDGKIQLSSILSNYSNSNLIIPLETITNGSYILELSNEKTKVSFNFVVSK